MMMVRSRRELFAVLILVSSCAASPSAGETQDGPLRIHLAMDATTYLVDQPIIVLACIENTGTEPCRDLPSLYAGDGYLRMALTREPGNDVIRGSGMMRDVMPSEEGITLDSGGYQCEAVNLLYWFGTFSKESNLLARAASQHRLPAGRYRVEATLYARTGLARLTPVVVKSEAIRFEIRDESGNDRFLSSFLAAVPPITGSRDQYKAFCEMVLPQSYSSPYFFLVYYGSGMSHSSVPIDSMLSGLGRADANPVRAAALLWLHAKNVGLADGPKLNWLGKTKKKVKGNFPLEHVLETWEIRLKQKKYYYPAE